MDSILSYNGVVTVISRVNGKVTSQKQYNSGTDKLFEAYARALSGQPIQSFIPTYVDLGTGDGDFFKSVLKNKVPITVTYVSKTETVYDVSYDYPSPFTRISATFTKHMTDNSPTPDLIGRLETSNGDVLATVEIKGLGNSLSKLGSGTQLILLWDLYVTNDSEEGDK